MNLTALKIAVETAAKEAKDLLADADGGRSQFAGAIYSTLAASTELIEKHEVWLKENPLIPAATINPTSTN